MEMNRIPKPGAPEAALVNPERRLPAAVVKHTEGAWTMQFNDLLGDALIFSRSVGLQAHRGFH